MQDNKTLLNETIELIRSIKVDEEYEDEMTMIYNNVLYVLNNLK